MVHYFDKHFKDWIWSACQDWGFPEPSEEYYEKVYTRLPEGLRYLLGLGVKEGLIIPCGRTFRLKGLGTGKGPYNWFAKYTLRKEPGINWEYFIQVAEFVRLYQIALAKNLTLTFEDGLMDLALYQNNKLIVYCEVKERPTQIQTLIKGIRSYQDGVNFSTPDRGNDPLRKAKYLLRKKPEYFCGVAIGARFEYRVTYSGQSFRFINDVIPWI